MSMSFGDKKRKTQLFFMVEVLLLNFLVYTFADIFEANHNKDYSVVKTLRVGNSLTLFLFHIKIWLICC